MLLAPGARLGPYEVLAKIGSGGMGEVYRARDTKLDRDVAIKVLPAPFTADAERLARFTREAHTLAALNHPNIAQIHGLEESGAVCALILEFVDGEDLSGHIARGPLPMAWALAIAKQLADALETAHNHGIIHRDLKPANIRCRADSTIKVLDFGVAKTVERASAGADSSTSSMGTREGTILGTAAYMSPEQARGDAVDKRTDIWAFGCVLFEMLAGRHPFNGANLSETVANVLKSEPDWQSLPADTPPSIQRLLRRCLEKDRARRLADAADARLEILDTQLLPAAPAREGPVAASSWRWRSRSLVGGVTLIVGAIAGGAAVWWTMPQRPLGLTRLTVAPAGAAAPYVNTVERDVAITPDGRRVVYVGDNGGTLFVRPLDRLDPVPIVHGVVRGVFTSPDGEWTGFVERGTTLKKVAMTGGSPIALIAMDGAARGATWMPDDSIVFATNNADTGLQRVSAAGGAASVLSRPNRDRGEADHLWPQRLPGNRGVLFTVLPLSGNLDEARVAVLDLRTGAHMTVLDGGSHAHHTASGHLVYMARGTLRAVEFDAERLTLRGTPVPVLSRLAGTPAGGANFDVAADGTLVYLDVATDGPGVTQTLVWFDREGREHPLGVPAREYLTPRVSPDGNRIIMATIDREQDLWRWDLPNGPLTRLTFEAGIDTNPVWTPDGRRIVFSSQRTGGVPNLYWQPADGTGQAERLSESPNAQNASSITPDGLQLVFDEHTQTQGTDIRLLQLKPTRQIASLVETPFHERNGAISPDGRWLAYESNSSGAFEVYVRPFPNVMEGQWQVSSGGGMQPSWSRSGGELFYVAADRALMAVPVERAADRPGARAPGSTIENRFGSPIWRPLPSAKVFEGRYVVGLGSRHYDTSPDGKRFVMLKASGREEATPQIIVVQNWHEELKRLVTR